MSSIELSQGSSQYYFQQDLLKKLPTFRDNIGEARHSVNSKIRFKVLTHGGLAFVLAAIALLAAGGAVAALIASTVGPTNAYVVCAGIGLSLVSIGCLIALVSVLVKARHDIKRILECIALDPKFDAVSEADQRMLSIDRVLSESLLCFDFEGGVTQYHIPSPRNDALDCSFIAAYSVLYIRDRLQEILAAIQRADIDAIKQVQIDILTEGYNLSHQDGKLLAEGAVNPNQLNRFTDAFKELNIPEEGTEIQTYVSTATQFGLKDQNEIERETRTELETFFEQEQESGELPYLFVVVDGQTFCLTRLTQTYAVLFDSHRSKFQVVDVDAAMKHIYTTMLCDQGLAGEILFFPSSV